MRERGVRSRGAGLQDVHQRRKAEAPFYRQLHQWLVQARHKAACVEHEQELLELQEHFLAGRISQVEMQSRVRSIVSKRPVSGADDAGQSGEKQACLYPSFWHHSISQDGAWQAYSGVDGKCCELLFQKQFRSGGKVSPTFRYIVECRTGWAASVFHFSLLKRFIQEPNGLTLDQPILAWDHLLNVKLTYAPADKTVMGRWENVHTIVSATQRNAYDTVLTGVKKLQRVFRFGPADPICSDKDGDDLQDAEEDRKAAKRKKKKARNKKKKDKRKEHAAKECETESSDFASPEVDTRKDREEVQVKQDNGKEVQVKQDNGKEVKEVKVEESSVESYEERLTILSAEIRDLVHHIESTMEKKHVLQSQIIWRTQNAVQEVFPCAKVHLFGSHACGFALPSSDIDLYYYHDEGSCYAVSGSGHQRHFPNNDCRIFKLPIQEQLEYIQNALREKTWVKSVELIKTTAMPIVRVSACPMALNGEAEDTHLQTRDHLCPMCCTIDLSCGHCPGHSNLVLSGLLAQQSKAYPDLKPLMLVLKQILVERRLCNVFAGGLSSFSLSLLILRYLQHLRQFPESITSPSSKHLNDRTSVGPFPSVISPRNGRFVDLTKDAEAQQELVTAYKRVLARWPRQETSGFPYLWSVSSPPNVSSNLRDGAPFHFMDLPLKEGATTQYRPYVDFHVANPFSGTQLGSCLLANQASNADSHMQSQLSNEVDPVVAQQFAAYHRQLADWPTGDAAHHFHWMKASWVSNQSLNAPSRSERTTTTQSTIETERTRSATSGSNTAENVVHPNDDAMNVKQGEEEEQQKKKESMGGLQGGDRIGEKLVGFLDFYGNHFNPAHVGVTVIGEGAFYLISESTLSKPPQPITIDNPCWPNLNVAASSYAISQVLQTWSQLHDKLDRLLTETVMAGSSGAEITILRKIIKAKWGAKSKHLLEHALRR